MKAVLILKLYTHIQQVKTWIKTTYLVSEGNVERYFNEFCYRINRSQNKETIFHNPINRMIITDKI
jgi:hypothetical protein